LARIIDQAGNILRLQRPYTHSGDNFETNGVQALKLKLQQVARFKEPACNVFTKAAWQRAGGYSTRFRFCFDLDFNVRVMRDNPCCLWNDFIVDLRRHAESDGAKFPADLAARELRQLIDHIYGYLGPAMTPADKVAGEAWYVYRLVELGLARFRASPRQFVDFLIKNRIASHLTPGVMARAASTVVRRAWLKDVQYTLP
jgi:hypothetical protein